MLYAPKYDLVTDNRARTEENDLPTSYMGVQCCSVTHTEMFTAIRDKHMLGAETNINFSKPSGFFTYHQVHIQKFYMVLAVRCIL
jgi:hypothetical protein